MEFVTYFLETMCQGNLQNVMLVVEDGSKIAYAT